MRVAIVGRNGRQIGGTESYLSLVSCDLSAGGHDVAFVHEVDVPTDRYRVGSAAGTPRWCVADFGEAATLEALRNWAPDVIYANGLQDSKLEFAMLAVAPVVFHAHDYYGTCISGAKMHASPRPSPCRRRFGARCVALYYPRRCGGWHPITMWRAYRRQQRRLEFLSRCSAIITSSRYVAAEYAGLGFVPERIITMPYPIGEIDQPAGSPSRWSDARPRETWRLLFLGRMDRLKGGDLFLRALPSVAACAPGVVEVTFAGDGAARPIWQKQALALQAQVQRLKIDFVGWADHRLRADLLTETDLLVLPSVWPEPFGLVGLEAARYAVPTAAFDVGGISEWLEDGVGGRLAPGNPPTSDGLASAIIDCLRDPQTRARLGAGARATVARFTRAGHLRRLSAVLEEATRSTRVLAPAR